MVGEVIQSCKVMSQSIICEAQSFHCKGESFFYAEGTYKMRHPKSVNCLIVAALFVLGTSANAQVDGQKKNGGQDDPGNDLQPEVRQPHL